MKFYYNLRDITLFFKEICISIEIVNNIIRNEGQMYYINPHVKTQEWKKIWSKEKTLYVYLYA